MLSKIAVLGCVAGCLAAGHSMLKPKFPILLKGDAGMTAPKAEPPSPAQQTPNPTNTAEQPRSADPTPQPTPASTPAQSTDVSIAEAFALFEQGKPFIDARHMDEYIKGHVRNAYQLSADELLAGKGMTWLGALDKNDFVVLYCGGGACDASHNLMNYLTTSFGFTKCRIMHEGWPAWQAAGHPGDTGEPLIGNDQ